MCYPVTECATRCDQVHKSTDYAHNPEASSSFTTSRFPSRIACVQRRTWPTAIYKSLGQGRGGRGWTRKKAVPYSGMALPSVSLQRQACPTHRACNFLTTWVAPSSSRLRI